ncbi:MAG: leucyl/phenylalanyl-tRNA--protein transferase [Verrucomicrobiota bacterium]|nr:leucyl/phenylalanyl-tRNA--protein transferase [Verrucomicrobiota bacterium]
MIPSLTKELWFPPAESASKNEDFEGLVAVNGDFSPERLALAYKSGIFPWTEKPVISWWSPDPRGIFEISKFKPSTSLKKIIKSGMFEVTRDKDFDNVIRGCADRPDSWITGGFIKGYSQLAEMGHAHSVECWMEGRLVGGLYGVAFGGLFAGESMFHRESNASKVALASLMEHLKERGFVLFDVQLVTPHTQSMGAIEISRKEYLSRLKKALLLKGTF